MKHFRNALLALAFTGLAAPVAAQTFTLDVIKSCPDTATPGEVFTCNFEVQNNTGRDVTQLYVFNYVPYPGGGPSGRIPCLNDGVDSQSLLDGEFCTGSFTESSAACGIDYIDRLTATGATGEGAASGFAEETVVMDACAPTSTPTNTPTPGPTGTPTPLPHGLAVWKGCVPNPVAGGGAYTCNFTVTNLSAAVVSDLIVVEKTGPLGTEFPVTGGCQQFGVPVFALGPANSPTDECSGAFQIIAPACSPGASNTWPDTIFAIGQDATFGSVQGQYTHNETIAACPTSTPTWTPSRTYTPGGPTLTPSITSSASATPTPTVTPTPTWTAGGPTITPTFTQTRTATPFPSVTAVPTVTPTPSRTPTSTRTFTPAATQTPVGIRCPAVLTGRIVRPDGTGVTGKVYFTLAKQGNITTTNGCCGPGAIGPPTTVSFTLTNGLVTGGVSYNGLPIVGNIALGAQIIPSSCVTSGTATTAGGNYYKMVVIDRKGTVVLRRSVEIPGWTADLGALPIHP